MLLSWKKGLNNVHEVKVSFSPTECFWHTKKWASMKDSGWMPHMHSSRFKLTREAWAALLEWQSERSRLFFYLVSCHVSPQMYMHGGKYLKAKLHSCILIIYIELWFTVRALWGCWKERSSRKLNPSLPKSLTLDTTCKVCLEQLLNIKANS